MKEPDFSVLAPRGTIRRFGAAGGFNTLLFWIFWELLRFSPVLTILSETAVWAFSWVLSCTIAHFVHRYFTFDGRKDVRSTMFGALVVYSIGGVLSTMSYDYLYSNIDTQIRLIFVINILIWGLFTWAAMRWLVFDYSPDDME